MIRRIKQTITVLVGLALVTIIGLFITVSCIDANKYRADIIDVLTKQTGREIKLSGPIKLGLSWSGATLAIQDASIGNPNWASRHDMAGIGTFRIGVALLPLLSHELVITELQVENADILLETSSDNKQHNWDFQVAAPQAQQNTPKAEIKTTAPSGKPIGIRVDHVEVKNSQLSIRSADGQTSVFTTKDMTFGMQSGGLVLHFDGESNNAVVTADVKTGAKDLPPTGTWPLSTDITYGPYHVQAKGQASVDKKTFSLDSYSLKAGGSTLQGKMSVNWGGPRPSARGTLTSDKLVLADLTAGASNGSATPSEAKAPAQPTVSPSRYVIPDTPLPIDGLKSADASLDVNVGEVDVGKAVVKNVAAKLNLANGVMTLSSIKAAVSQGEINGEIKLDGASVPPQLSMTFTASNIDLADMLRMANMPAFVTGKANADMAMASAGGTPHALAASANGHLNVTAASGQVSSSQASDISSSLLRILSPQGGDSALNCMAVRLNAAGGVVKDNGILADTSPTTVLGKGGFNLRDETIDLSLRARTKLLNVSSIMPPLHIGGTFKSPSYSVDPTALVQNVTGILTSGSLDGGVPTMQSAAGQNACIYTLDHPQAAQPTNLSTDAKALGKNAKQQVKALGSQLKGLFGK